MTRRLGIIRRKSLEGAAEGWGNDCYVTFRPASYQDMIELKNSDVEAMTETEGIAFMIDFIKSRVIGGQVMVLTDDDELAAGKLEKDDITLLPPDTINALFSEITGANLDPKGTAAAALNAQASPSAGPATGTLSSTG